MIANLELYSKSFAGLWSLEHKNLELLLQNCPLCVCVGGGEVAVPRLVIIMIVNECLALSGPDTVAHVHNPSNHSLKQGL